MNRLLKLLVVIFFVLTSTQLSWAEEYKILVLPDNIDFNSTNYYIYPDSSVMFASDTINEIKKDGRIKTVSMTEIRDSLRKNTKLSLLTKNALKEFKYNYNVPFVDFKEIAHTFSTNKVLVITSQTDTQNYILRRTLWDFLNIPGAAVIDPAYKLCTYAALIDVDKEIVLWQNTYYKKLASVENRMVASSFAPATQQLEKIKFYSAYMLSPSIAKMVETRILPPPIQPDKNDKIVPIAQVKTIDETIKPEKTEETMPEAKIFVPQRPTSKNYGEIINDL